jgi:hypothetical protein
LSSLIFHLLEPDKQIIIYLYDNSLNVGKTIDNNYVEAESPDNLKKNYLALFQQKLCVRGVFLVFEAQEKEGSLKFISNIWY